VVTPAAPAYPPRVVEPSTPLETVLSPRELKVLELTAQGLTNARVARDLDVTVHAVKFHLASIYRKLGVANRTQASAMYLRSQLGRGVVGVGG
jgi:DNA-binding CsgD family transcriptional regulator